MQYLLKSQFCECVLFFLCRNNKKLVDPKIHMIGWALGSGVTMPVGVPAFHTGVLGFESQPYIWFLLPANTHSGMQQVIIQVLRSLPPTQETQNEFQNPHFSLTWAWLLQEFEE